MEDSSVLRIYDNKISESLIDLQVSYLQNDYGLLENKQNELKTTIQNLLQSRESFLNAYQVIAIA